MIICFYIIAVLLFGGSTSLLGAESNLATVSASELVYMRSRNGMTLGRLCQEIRALPPSQKAIVAEKVKQAWSHAKTNSDYPNPEQYEPFLVAVGDLQMIDGLIGRFLKYSRERYALSVSGNPIVIARMGENLLGDNRLRQGSDDAPGLGIADGTWNICRSIILAAPEFSSELKAWAQIAPETMGYDGDDGLPNEHIMVIREWWKLNRAAFQAGEFGQVKPGGVHALWKQAAAKPVGPPKQSDRSRNDAMPQKQDADTVTPTPSSPVANVSTRAGSDPLPGGWALWAGIAAVVAASAGWLFLRGRRSRLGR